MPYLLDSWRQVAERLRNAGSVALFLDFDGTLAKIRPRPDDVRLNPATRRALARLTRNSRVHVCIISGRRLADVRGRTRLPRVLYLGLHGWEGGGGALSLETQTFLKRTRQRLEGLIDQMPGVWIEDKGDVFAVHTREASEQYVGAARAAVGEIAARLPARLRVLRSRFGWEVLPSAIGNKGTAVLRELSQLGPRVLPVYIGDDSTDEPAFAALSAGVTARVGVRPLTRARFRLRDPGEVRRFLERMEIELS